MQADEQAPVQPVICGICGQPKKLLKRSTEQTLSPIYVCDTMVGKAKMPCDGNLYKIATKS